MNKLLIKRLFFSLLSFGFVILGCAQSPNTNLLQKYKDIANNIDNITTQIDSLKIGIHDQYIKYCDLSPYTNKKTLENALKELDIKKDALRNRIIELNDSIITVDKECQRILSIRYYYENGNIDSLFIHADLTSLQIHKQLLGKEYPKIMDDLQILLECRNIMTNSYDARQNNVHLEKIEKVESCETKDYLKGLLLIHKDITDEVYNWLREEKHSLYSMAVFSKLLNDNYGISLEEDFIYLFDMVTEAVTSSIELK